VNRDIVSAQVESSIIFGLTSTFWGEINIQRGRVQQTNFDTYRASTRSRASTRISSTAPSPRAASASPLPRSSPRPVCNAIYAAGGQRLRSLPLARHNFA
jgi:isoquinoline 1-oxidoreductase beta subunit